MIDEERINKALIEGEETLEYMKELFKDIEEGRLIRCNCGHKCPD